MDGGGLHAVTMRSPGRNVPIHNVAGYTASAISFSATRFSRLRTISL